MNRHLPKLGTSGYYIIVRNARVPLLKVVTAIRLLAAIGVLVAQMGVIGAAAVDARNGASAASHLESGGTNLHYAHNEADCFMCRAQHLGDAAPLKFAPVFPEVSASSDAAERVYRAVTLAEKSPQRSRAPPPVV